MRIRQKLKDFIHSCFAPLFLLIVVFILSIILLFNTFFFRSVYKSMESNIYSLITKQENEHAGSITDMLTQFASLAGKIVKDEKLSWKSFSRDSVSCVETLSTYNLPFHKYSALYLYYKQEKNMLSINGTCSLQVAFPGISHTDFEADILGLSQPAIISLSQYGAEPDNASLVFAYPYQNRTVVLYLIKHDTLWSMLNDTSERDSKAHFMLKDNQSIIYADSLQKAECYLKALAETDSTLPACKVKIESTDYLLLKNRISDSIMLYSFTPLTVQTKHLSRMMVLNLACIIFVIFMGIILLLILYTHGYRPIARLADSAKQLIGSNRESLPKNELETLRQAFLQYGQLSREYEKNASIFNQDQMKNVFILRVMNGHYQNGDSFRQICTHIGIQFPYSHFCACVALFDSANADRVLPPIETQNSFAVFCQAGDRKSAIGILNCPPGTDYTALGMEMIQHLQSTADELPTIAIGCPVTDIQSIPVSYNEARSALDYRLIFGLHTVILYDQIAADDKEAIYPRGRLDAILKSLNNWDIDVLQTQLEDLVQTIRRQHLSLQQTKSVCIELSSAFMREIHHFNNKHLSESEQFDVFRICEYNSIDELVKQISEMTDSMRNVLQQRDMLCRDHEIRKCLTIMNENVGNEQFSLEQLCEAFDLTPQTLRRRFKNATGKTMNDYLIGLRVELAKRLLSGTSLDIVEIAHQCGYVDQSSFIRAFKVKEEVTPGQYRDMQKSSIGDE